MNVDIDCRIVKETAFGVYYAVNLTELFIELFNLRKWCVKFRRRVCRKPTVFYILWQEIDKGCGSGRRGSSSVRGKEKNMLELTVTSGTELKIGDDIKIIFRGGNTPGRMQIGVDAPKEKQVERVKVPEAQRINKVFIVRNENNLMDKSGSKREYSANKRAGNQKTSSADGAERSTKEHVQ